MDPPPDGWRIGTVTLGILLLFPLVLVLIAVSIALKIALFVVGFSGRRSGGRSFIDELLFFRILQILTRRKDKIPFYSLRIKTTSGIRMARQEGEFKTGQIVTGHKVTLHGKVRHGVMIITSGTDQTVGVKFIKPTNPYPYVFFVLAAFFLGMILLSHHSTIGGGM